MSSVSEKRQHERILVEGVWMELPSGRYCVVDISEKAFRVVGFGEDMIAEKGSIRATLVFGEGAEAIRETVETHIIRTDKAFNVFRLPRRNGNWMDFIEGFRALKSDQLDTALFD